MLIISLFGMFSSPIILRQLLIFISEKKDEPMWVGLLLAFAMFIGKIVEFQFYNVYFQPIQRLNMKVFLKLLSHLSLL
jgi:hypothetical protein